MTTEQRAALEQLFGKEKLYTSTPEKPSATNLYDYKICKSFLVGTCPHDLFVGTKEDLGRCKKQHLGKYKLLYESEKKKLNEDEKARRMVDDFEYEYVKDLQHFINQASRKAEIAAENLRHTPEEQMKIEEITKKLDEMDARIGLLNSEIKILANSGEIVEAAMLTEKQDKMLKEREEISKSVKEITDRIGQAHQQKLEVCEVCGAYLSRLDSDRRLADHFSGKIHMGYVFMRRELKRLSK